MRRSIPILLAIVLSGIALVTYDLAAESRWRWPENPKNLTELKGFNGEKLRPMMLGFTRALGVRCTHCHVGEDGKPLETFDFASDANPNKDKARAMLRMLGSINEQLKQLEPGGEHRVNMWCHTCHRGRPRPTTLGEELTDRYAESRAAGAVARYRELKAQFHGRGSYDFGEGSLTGFGYEVLGQKDAAGAIAIFELLTEEFPQSSNAWDSLGEACLAAGKKDLALAHYRRSLELDPKNENAKKVISEIEAESASAPK
jgi:tetratricopeptide (TPR) repeat protein